MKIEYDPAKRLQTLASRGLDFEDAIAIFEGDVIDIPDNRGRLWRDQNGHGWMS
jgi:uncharacterized DUF497 family protein